MQITYLPAKEFNRRLSMAAITAIITSNTNRDKTIPELRYEKKRGDRAGHKRKKDY